MRYFTLIILMLISITIKAQFLKTNGTAIRDMDGAGDTVIWRGMGLGGWMLQEGYMLNTGGAQYQIEARIESLIGKDKKEEFYNAWRANHMRKIDVDSLKSWGFNTIRLPMNYKLFTPPIEEEASRDGETEPRQDTITFLEEGFTLTDSLLSWCKANDIYLILDLHSAPGGQGQNSDINDYDPSKPSLFTSRWNQRKMVELWKKLAERYKDEPMIAAYDLINEPNWSFDRTDPTTSEPNGTPKNKDDANGCQESENTPLWDLQKEITDSIRAIDNNHIIVIEGNCWGGNYSGLPDTLWDDNLVISYHKYWNGTEQGDMAPILATRDDRNVPIWMGETGENSNSWFTNAVRLFENNDIGWSWWPLKKLGLNNPLQIKSNPGYDSIASYWGDSTRTKPSEESAYNALMQLAKDLKLENNIYHEGVVDALIRQPFSDETLPFKNRRHLPGGHRILSNDTSIILLTDYDMGKQGFAYSDNEYTNVSNGSGFQSNLGGGYRNDGVDIEGSEDESKYSNGYNVAWTVDGEWLNYTINVDSFAAYDMTLRYASNEGKIHMELDGTDISGLVNLPSTEGFQAWKDTILSDLILEKGKHELRLAIDKGGPNLGYMYFRLAKGFDDAEFKALSATTIKMQDSVVFLTLSKPISVASIAKDNFTVKVNDQIVSIDTVTMEEGETRTLKIMLNERMYDDQTIKVSYNGTQQIQTPEGDTLAAFEDLIATNNLVVHHLIPGKIEAEDFSVNKGLELEDTKDHGGGKNTGYADTGDYLEYNIRVEETTVYEVSFRVASQHDNTSLKLEQYDQDRMAINQKIFSNLPNTTGWQTWKTVNDTMTLNEGRYVMRLTIAKGEFNLNWFSFEKYDPNTTYLEIPGKIEAEDFVVNEGFQLEPTTDDGGGQNIGFVHPGDYSEYDIRVSGTGSYEVSYRVASEMEGPFQIKLEQYDDQGMVINEVTTSDLPGTGGWQTWITVKDNMTLTMGTGTLRLTTVEGEYNVNWIEFEKTGVTAVNDELNSTVIYPNPASEYLNLSFSQSFSGSIDVKIVSLTGEVVNNQKGLSSTKAIDLKNIPQGIYVIEVMGADKLLFRGNLIIK